VRFSGAHGFLRDASWSGFTLIKVPGASSTDAMGINNSDLIVGYHRVDSPKVAMIRESP
jgi:hypothetical protein